MSTGVRLVIALVCVTLAVSMVNWVQRLDVDMDALLNPDVELVVSGAQATKVGSPTDSGKQQVSMWFDVTNRGHDDAYACMGKSALDGGLESEPVDIRAGATVAFNFSSTVHAGPDALQSVIRFSVWAVCGSFESNKPVLTVVIPGQGSNASVSPRTV